jgi:hypothetical protein
MLDLSNTTCVFVNGNNPSDSSKFHYLITNLQNRIKFHKILYFTCGEFLNCKNTINLPVNQMGYEVFNNFCLRVIPSFITSDYALYTQTDGFPINPHLWRDEFFQYDYIGAPWPDNWIEPHPYREGWRQGDGGYVYGGNGGFSFRSRKLLQEVSKVNYFQKWNEDWIVCYFEIENLMQNGLRFSDIETGKKFSLESDFPNHHNDLRQVFGFHHRERLEEGYGIFKENFELNESL